MSTIGERVHVARHDVQENVKVAVRTALHRRNLDLVKGPLPARVSAALRHFGLTTVIDVGANVGQYGRMLRATGYRGQIVSCEPLSHAYAQLAKRAAADPAWTTVRTALGAEAGHAEINISDNSFSSSLLPITRAHTAAAPGSAYVGSETVEVSTLALLLEQHAIDPATTWLKIDTQGYEGPVLDGAGARLTEFGGIQLELSFVTLYEGQALFDDVVARLRAEGFVLWGLEAGFSDPETGRTLQCDGLFVRHELAAKDA